MSGRRKRQPRSKVPRGTRAQRGNLYSGGRGDMPADVRIGTTIGRTMSFPNQSAVLTMRTSQSFTSSAGGVLSAALTNDPHNSGDWNSAVALFDSYRIQQMQVDYSPNQSYNMATNVALGGAILASFDPDATAAPASLATVLNKSNLRMMDPTKPWSFRVSNFPRITSASAFAGSYTIYGDGFIDTASPVATSAILLYGENFQASTNFGTLYTTYYIRFVVRT